MSDAAIYALSNFAVAGVPFLLMPVLTRELTPDAYGIVAMFNVVVSLLAVCVGLNVHGAIIVKFYDRASVHLPDFVTTCLLILAASTVVFCIGVVVFSDVLFKVTSIDVQWLVIAALVAALQFVVQTLLSLLQATKRPMLYGAMRIGQAVADGAFSLALVVVLNLSWHGRLAGITMAWLISGGVAIYLMIRAEWLTKTPSMACAKDALRYGLPLVPHSLGALLLGMADRFLVTNLLDVGSTGVYIVGVQIGMVLGIAADAFNRAFTPWLMETLQDANLAKKIRIVKCTYLYFVAIFLTALLGTAIAPHLMGVLIGSRYEAAGTIVGYMLIGNAFMGMYYMVTNYIFITRRTELLSGLTIVVGSAVTGLTWFLIKEHGIEGAAQAFMIGQAILFMGTWLIANYCYDMPWLEAIKRFKQA